MKVNTFLLDIKNREISKNLFESKKDKIKENNKPFSINLNFSFNTSYNQLKQNKIISLNIIKSRISIDECYQPNPFISESDISKINEIYNKYKDYPLAILESFQKRVKTNISENIINNSKKDIEKLSLNSLNSNENIFGDNLIKDINNNNFINLSKPLTFFETESLSKNLFLNKKRKKQKKNEKSIKKKNNIDFIFKKRNKIVKDNNNEINNSNKNQDIINKKIIFYLSKGERSKNKLSSNKLCNLISIKKLPGRKKKNSGEIGAHNKFSKDNMMRKLKNKAMESARKLINRVIKNEANNDFKNFREIRKIEGIYSQELNIKFNFWFYFQPLKNIFQFKMSSKYSKGDLNSNNNLINKICSKETKNKFPKTNKLLEMKFHEYYHHIFLGEKQNWYLDFDIKEKDNKYQLDYFLNNGVSKLEKDYIRYKNTMYNLACKYESFFLKKNPRLTGNKKNKEKESQSKKIVNNISIEEFEYYRYHFVAKGVHYVPEMRNTYARYLEDNKDYFQENALQTLNNINNNIYDMTNQLKIANKNQENSKNIINIINNNIHNTIEDSNNNKKVNNNENINNENVSNNENVNNNEIANNKININNKKKSINNENIALFHSINSFSINDCPSFFSNNINKVNKSISTSEERNRKQNLFFIKKKICFEIVKIIENNKNKKINYSPIDTKNSYKCMKFSSISKINISNDEESNKKIEKEIQTENNLLQEESSQNIEIII